MEQCNKRSLLSSSHQDRKIYAIRASSNGEMTDTSMNSIAQSGCRTLQGDSVRPFLWKGKAPGRHCSFGGNRGSRRISPKWEKRISNCASAARFSVHKAREAKFRQPLLDRTCAWQFDTLLRRQKKIQPVGDPMPKNVKKRRRSRGEKILEGGSTKLTWIGQDRAQASERAYWAHCDQSIEISPGFHWREILSSGWEKFNQYQSPATLIAKSASESKQANRALLVSVSAGESSLQESSNSID